MGLRTKRDVPLVLLVGAVLWSCASNDSWLGDVPGTQGPALGSTDASTEASADGASTLMCVATECPKQYTTCPSDYGPTYKCSVDLRRDSKNCGECGHECARFEPLHMTSRCIESRCELECESLPVYVFPEGQRATNYKNCNGLLDDGCEVDLFADAENCGVCGNACPSGKRCINGQCGCPDGLADCNGFCVNLSHDNANCSSCGNECFEPADVCDPMPANTAYGCVEGECERMKCDGWNADCDNDLGLGCASNGCETSLLDPLHCGACDKVCGPDEACRAENDVIGCFPKCELSGKVTCPDDFCADFQNDPNHCGGCGLLCPPAGPNQQASCSKGVCVNTCAEGFGDCNGDPTDGCETNLMAHPSNCGACGVSCDLSVGQPCVEGKCLVAPCEGSEAK
jgi:hypothetical protein